MSKCWQILKPLGLSDTEGTQADKLIGKCLCCVPQVGADECTVSWQAGRGLLNTSTSPGNERGNSAGACAVICSWKNHSTYSILGIDQGEVFPLGRKYKELETEAAEAERAEDKQEKPKETLSNATLNDDIKNVLFGFGMIIMPRCAIKGWWYNKILYLSVC